MGYSFLPEKKYQLILLYKMINGLCPDYLSSLVPRTVGNNTEYNLVVNLIRNRYAQILSFLPLVVRDWNEVPHTSRNAKSISAFKRSINSTLIDVPSFFLYSKRIWQIYDARLRMDCSSLNHHLCSKTSLTVRYSFMIEHKLPNITCLIVTDLTTCARK